MCSCSLRPTVSLSDYSQTVRSGGTSIPAAVEIEKLFGSADHFITHFGFDYKPKVWNSEVFFGGRYTLTMVVDVDIDYSKKSVRQIGEPKFYLLGVASIERIPPSGQLMARYSGDEHWLSEKQWRRVYESGGDFSTVGISLRPEPVAGFEEFAAGYRRDRIPISLLDLPKPP